MSVKYEYSLTFTPDQSKCMWADVVMDNSDKRTADYKVKIEKLCKGVDLQKHNPNLSNHIRELQNTLVAEYYRVSNVEMCAPDNSAYQPKSWYFVFNFETLADMTLYRLTKSNG